MKKVLTIFMVLFISSTCFGMELNKSQKKILKYYPSWTKKQKTTYFIETSNYFSESCPQTIDKMSTLLTVEPFLEEPGLRYIIKFSVEKIVNSKEEWDDLFKDMRMNMKNNLCSDQSLLFFRKLKDVFFVYDYYDKNSIFLKRLAFYLCTTCAENKVTNNKLWDDESYTWFGNIITSLTKFLKTVPSKNYAEQELRKLSNSKPYIKNGQFQGQSIFLDNKEFMFIFFGYDGDHVSDANVAFAPAKKNVFDVGNGYYAFIDQDNKSYTISILKANKSAVQ